MLACSVLIGACTGEIGGAPGNARGGPTPDFGDAENTFVPNGVAGAEDPFPQDDPTCPSAAAVVSASNGWQSSEASQPAFDTLEVSFLVRPASIAIDALVGVGAQDMDDFSDAILTVRFVDGFIDVRDGSVYRSDETFAYEPNVWYVITISTELATGTYDVEVARCGEPPQLLISDAAFRAEASPSDRLTTWGVWSSQSASAALDVSTPSWVASGSCAPATCQSLGIECGTVTDGCGGNLSCGGCASGQTCATGGVCIDVPVPPTPAPPPPPGETGGRGPTGQWPPGFPAYSTAADIVTNGTDASLRSALTNATCSNGCVIQHAGNVSGRFSSRSGSGAIVVRPPIGQRAEFSVSATILVDNLLFAGYGGGSVGLKVGDDQQTGGAVNSGYAWIESDASNGHGYFAVNCNGGSVSEGLFYEVVFKRYADINQEWDRGGLRGGWPPGSGGTCDAKIVGSWIAGVTCPNGTDHPQGVDCHSDTFQEYVPNGTCLIEFTDSILWGSEDKVLQGSLLPPCGPHEANNSTFIAPSYAQRLWTGPSFSWYGSGPQPFHTTADLSFVNSTLIGPVYPDADITYQSSELYQVTGGSDLGGNSTLGSLPSVPRAPTHSELDAIWSP